jgi:hypothetical protein
MENKSTKPAQKKALRKTDVMRWLDYPSQSPELGEEIVVMYGDSNKKEIVTWTMKFVGTGIKFRWIRLPAIT